MKPIREYTQYDEKGELVFTHTTTIRKVHRNYAVFFTVKMRELIETVPNLSTLRLVMMIASKQAFSKGVAVSTEKLCNDLKLSRQAIQAAKKWLIDNQWLKIVKREGINCWWLNPELTTRGFKDFQKKLDEWKGVTNEKDIGNGVSATILSTEPDSFVELVQFDSDEMDNTD